MNDDTPRDPCTVYLGNVPYTATVPDLASLFAPWHPVGKITYPHDVLNGHPKGCAFIRFATPDAAAEAIAALDGSRWMGRRLRAELAKQRSTVPIFRPRPPRE